MFRRLVVGLAVAAFVAPAAQARVDGPGGGTQADQSAPVIQGDDKVLASGGGSAVLIHGDDKVIVGQPGDSTVLIHGDDKVFAPSQTTDYTLAGYRRALPQDYGTPAAVLAGDDKVIVGQPGDSTVLIHGDDKVFAPSQTTDYTLAGYRRALPQDYGTPAAVPVASPSVPSTFDWRDALIGAGVALALALLLLAGSAALGSRRRTRPAAA